MKSDRPSFLRAGGIYAAANVLSAAVPFLLLPLLTRVLDSSAYGRITVFFAVFSFSTALSGLSLHGAVGVRWFSLDRQQFPGFLSSCIVVSVASTALAAALAFTVVSLAAFELGLSANWITLAVISAGLNSIVLMRLVLWQSQGQPLKAAGFQIALSVVNVSLSVYGVVSADLEAAGRMGGAGLAYLLMAAFALVLLTRDGMLNWRPRREFIQTALRFGVPLIPHGIGGVVMAMADRLIVAERLGPAAVGIYGVAAQMGMVMSIAADAFVKAYGPWMYARLAEKKPEDRYVLVGTVYLSIPFFLLLAVIGSWVLSTWGPLLIGSEFHGAVRLVWIFVLGGAFTGMYYSVAGFFFYSSRTEWLSAATGVSAVIGIALCYWLVGQIGLTGGAVAFAITQVTLFGLVTALAMITTDLPWREVPKSVSVALARLTGR